MGKLSLFSFKWLKNDLINSEKDEDDGIMNL